MTKQTDAETEDRFSISRRDMLKTVGAAGTFGAIGTENVGGKQPKRHYIGTEPGKAHVAKQNASEVSNIVEMEGIGPTVTGRWPEEALKGLRKNPHVRYVEEEQFDQPLYDLPDERLPWGIDRVDAEFAHDGGYTGSGIDVAVSDTGIDSDHPDLNTGTGYATSGAACSGCDEDWEDATNGHGTHVAGTIGAIDNPKASSE